MPYAHIGEYDTDSEWVCPSSFSKLSVDSCARQCIVVRASQDSSMLCHICPSSASKCPIDSIVGWLTSGYTLAKLTGVTRRILPNTFPTSVFISHKLVRLLSPHAYSLPLELIDQTNSEHYTKTHFDIHGL